MAIGVMLSGIVSGLAGVIWMLIAGHSVLLVLVCYPVAGLLGAVAFILLATLRHMIPMGSEKMVPVLQG